MPPRYRHRGFTLPEILISTGIMSMVLLGAYSLIVFSLRWNAKMSDTVATYQQALKATTRITHDLGTGSQSSFIYDIDGEAFAFASARPSRGPYQLDSTGQVLWQKHIVYYVEDGTLYRNELPIVPPQAGPPETPDLPILKAQLTSKGAIMARKLSELEIEPGSGASIVFKVEGEQRDKNSITLRSRMTFRQ